MSARNHLREIDDAVRETFDLRTRHEATTKAGSRRNVYEKSLDEVSRIAGDEASAALAEWIEERIRTNETFPSGRDVRQRGAKICRELGHDVPTGSWLGA